MWSSHEKIQQIYSTWEKKLDFALHSLGHFIRVSKSECWHCKTCHTYFTAESIGDQLSSLEQESEDTIRIVQTKFFTIIQCTQRPNFWAKEVVPSWRRFVLVPFLREGLWRTKSRESLEPGAQFAASPVFAWGGGSTQALCTQKYENTK